MIVFSYIVYFSKPVVRISNKLPRWLNQINIVNHPQPVKLDLFFKNLKKQQQKPKKKSV